MIRDTIKIYLRLMRPHKTLWILSFVLSFLFFIGLDIVNPWILSRFIGDLSEFESFEFSHFSSLILIWALVRIGVFFFGRIQIRLYFHALTRTQRDIDLESFRVTLSQSSDYFANNFVGSIVTKYNRFTRSFEVLSSAATYDLTSLSVQLIFPIIILFVIAPPIAILLLIWAIIYAYFLLRLQKMKIPRSRKVANFDSKITGVIADSITNVLSIKMFARMKTEQNSFRELSQERIFVRLKNMFFSDYIRIYKALSTISLQLVVLYLSAKFAFDGTLEIADIILIQLFILQLATSLWNFGKLIEKLEEALADATEMTDEVYKVIPSVKDVAKPDKLESVQGNIALRDVGFTYEGDNENAVFTQLNISIPKGQKVGFVGPSGGGKTTLTKLLLRFMDVDSGEILIDGQNIATVTQDNLRASIAYVPQEPLLFHRTILENIRYGDPKASDEEVYEAAKLAHADEFVQKLPIGYETLVGERGVKLSGGQKQRVAIARAMLKKAPILILDEATSALDSKSEKLIVKALDTLMQNRTTIVIAHRLSTIKKLDRIIVLTEDGVQEDGTHNNLLKQKGLYAELWSHQHDDFI